METNEVNFHFPFEPYPVQLTFMKTLHKVLEHGKVGIFESPTGTGKSLSIICASLAWLKEFNSRNRASLEAEITELTRQISLPVDAETDWITRDSENILRRCQLRDVQIVRDALLKKEKKYQDLKEKVKRKGLTDATQGRADFLRKDVDNVDKELLDISQLLSNQKEEDSQEDEVPDYHSDDEEDCSDDDDDPAKELPVSKIIYCSRTHSQLSQFVKELKKTVYGENTRTVSLASRSNLCINETVTKLASLSLMNDKCLDMQKKPSPKSSTDVPDCKRAKRSDSAKCPFYRHQAMEGLAGDILVEVQDIEQIVHHGKQARACPYYSSRYATPDAELVLIPYNILLQQSARDAWKLALKGNVVIIDEAHNLLETINNTHSVELRSSNIAEAYCLLNEYFNRYRSRMNTKNVMYVKQILFILKSFMTLLGGRKVKGAAPEASSMSTVHVFLVTAGISNMNLFKIQRYLERSKIALKLRSYSKKTAVTVSKQTENSKPSTVSSFINSLKNGGWRNVDTPASRDEEPQRTSSSSSPLIAIEAFIRAVNCSYDDGRVLVSKTEDTTSSHLKYVLLNPSNYFKDIVSQARAVILAGGTMEPTSEFVDQLLVPAGVQPDRILHFACGHVVPKANLCAMALSHGPSGKALEFTYQNRADAETIQELGNLLVNVVRVVPGGVVCFFPSYEYEKVVSEKWKSSGLVDKLAARKRIFREPIKSSELEKTLTLYSQSAKSTGALLFAVVGGKMSEGINFSDDMGRCVMMVGLPFPNMRSPEMKSKIDFLNANYPKASDGRSAGQVYYDNVCMKAVNQSIGRAIRHKDDYATILLVDQRYQRPTISKALPSWIQDSLTAHTKFGTAFAAIQRFFRVDRTVS
ncbi:unnamed protein product [Ixodes hexagonus]